MLMAVLLLFFVMAPCYDWSDDGAPNLSPSISSLDVEDTVLHLETYGLLHAVSLIPAPVTVLGFRVLYTPVVLVHSTPVPGNLISRAPPAISV
jgi:hypothetical protein